MIIEEFRVPSPLSARPAEVPGPCRLQVACSTPPLTSPPSSVMASATIELKGQVQEQQVKIGEKRARERELALPQGVAVGNPRDLRTADCPAFAGAAASRQEAGMATQARTETRELQLGDFEKGACWRGRRGQLVLVTARNLLATSPGSNQATCHHARRLPAAAGAADQGGRL